MKIRTLSEMIAGDPGPTIDEVLESADALYPRRGEPSTQVAGLSAGGGVPFIGSRRIDIAHERHSGFPGMAQTRTGRLLAVWRLADIHGVTTGAGRGVLLLAHSDDLGRTWSAPKTIVDNNPSDTKGPKLTVGADGTVYLTHAVIDGEGVADSTTSWLIRSHDGGDTWEPRVEISSSHDYESRTAAPLVELDDGTLLCPLVARDASGDDRSSVVLRSSDGGDTWGEEAIIADGTVLDGSWNEPVIVALDDGRLLCLIRVHTAAERAIYATWSTDQGHSWSAPIRLFTGTNIPISIQAASGGVFMVTRGYDFVVNGKMLLYASWDGGETWEPPVGVEPDGITINCEMVEVSTGVIAIIYALQWDEDDGSVHFRYLLDGPGVSPLGDDSNPSATRLAAAADTGRWVGWHSFESAANVPLDGWLSDGGHRWLVEGASVPVVLDGRARAEADDTPVDVLYGTDVLDDCEVEASVRGDAAGFRQNGVLLRWTDADNHIRVKVRGTAAHLSLVARVGGVESGPAAVDLPAPGARFVRLRVVAVGTDLWVFADGHRMLTYELTGDETALVSGNVGIQLNRGGDTAQSGGVSTFAVKTLE